MKRRDFLRNTAATSTAAFTAPYIIPRSLLAAPGRPGPNDRIRVGIIGAGGRSRQLAVGEKMHEMADIVAIADCYLPHAEQERSQLPGAEKITIYQDYRHLPEKEKIDAVFIPTTTHARALIAIHAMQAGLDIYAEKPIALTTEEGRILVTTARKHKRVFQAGTQQRSMPINIFASRLVREGALGKVHTVMACNFIGPERWEPRPAQEMPEGLDWDMWCNQTELRPYRKELHHGWAQWWAYDNGGKSWGVSGWGTHALDQVQAALGTSETGPVEIWPAGKDDEGIMKVTMRYADGTLLKMHGPRRTKAQAPELPDLGARFIGEKGWIEIKRGQVDTNRPELFEDAPPDTRAPAIGETHDHLVNFFECMRTRRKPNADVEYAHRSTTVCMLMTICRELDRRLHWNPGAERFIDDRQADTYLARPRRQGYELPAGVA